MKFIQRYLYTFANMLAGGIALVALVISYGRITQPDSLYFYFVGVFTWIFASIILIMKPDDDIVRSMYILSVVFMGICSVDATFSISEGGWHVLFVPIFQFISSAFLPCLFFRYFSTYPSEKQFAKSKFFRWGVYLPGFVLFIVMLWSYLSGNTYRRSFFLINISPVLVPNFIFLFAYSIAGQACLIHTWRKGETLRQRKQAKWLLLGVTVGTLPLSIFNAIPFVFNIDFPYGRYSAYTLIMIMVCYGIAIVRHRLMDLELAINRSTVYAIVSSMAIISYLVISKVLGKIFTGISPRSGTAIEFFSILIVAMLFAPAKQRVQEILEKLFYQQTYHYKKVLFNLSKALSSILSLDELSEIVLSQLYEALSPAFIAIALSNDSNYKIHKHFGNSEKLDETLKDLNIDVIKDEPERLSRRCLAIPLISKGSKIGFIFIGGKLSGNEYSLEDISLMRTLSPQVAIAIENANIYEKLRYRVKYIEDAYSQLIATFKNLHTEFPFIEKPLSGQQDIISELDIITQALIGSSNKLGELNELKSQFLSNVSHELRTPLTSIKGYADNLIDGVVGELDEKQKRYFERISRNCERLIKLIKDLLSLSRIEVGKNIFNPSKFPIYPLINDIVSDFSPEATKKGISLLFDCPSDIFIYADSDKLKEIIINLVDNAIKFTHQKGIVSIYVEDKDESIDISVKDTGIGIPHENLSLIFDRYHQVQQKNGNSNGMGIGLAIVKSLAELHHGRISVQSESGEGSCFSLSLPKQQADILIA
jgi:signal transduction histidine kinase